MALSLTIAMAVPAAAGENEWTSPAKPAKEGGDGDWFYSPLIDEGPGPLAKASDGTFYCYAMIDGEAHVFQSTDDARTWDKTDYYKDLNSEMGSPPDAVVDFAPSSLDADALYATDGASVFYTKNAGDKWQTVADVSLQDAKGDEWIYSVDVGYDASDNPFVFIGTDSDVYYVSQGGYPAQWTPLEIFLPTYAVAASPEFADTDEIFAVSDNGTDTVVYNNLHGTVGDWDELALLKDDLDGTIVATEASRICFPDNFDDDNYEMFVGISGNVTDPGSVYRVDDGHSYCLGKEDGDIKDKNVVSLDITGSFGATSLIAGTYGTATGTDDKVIVSTDDGDSWDDASKEPSGQGRAFVIMDEDFETTAALPGQPVKAMMALSR